MATVKICFLSCSISRAEFSLVVQHINVTRLNWDLILSFLMFYSQPKILSCAINLASQPKLLTLVCPVSKFISTHELNKYHMCWIVYALLTEAPGVVS